MDKLEKPTETLEEFLQMTYEAEVAKYKKLIRVMRELDVENIYQFRAGMDRIAKDLTVEVANRASAFWGRMDVEHGLLRRDGRSILRRASDEVSTELDAEKAAKEAEKATQDINALREAYSKENPAPNDAPVSILFTTVRVMNCIKEQNMKTIGNVLDLSEAEWKEVPKFGRRSLIHLKESLAEVGRSFDEYQPRTSMVCAIG